MKITRFILREMGSYSPVVQRPYAATVNDRSTAIIGELTENGSNLTSGVLAYTGVLKPDANLGAVSDIANGWGTRRYAFILEVQISQSPTIVVEEVLQGWTDHNEGISMTGAIDRNMRLFFNSKMTKRVMSTHGRYGHGLATSINDACQFLNRPQCKNLVDAPSMARPQDIFSATSVTSYGDSIAGDYGYFDARTSMVSPLHLSRRTNALPGAYLSRTFKAYKSAVASQYGDEDLEDVASTAKREVMEPSINQSTALTELSIISNLRENGSVTYGELVTANPYLDEITEVYRENMNLSRRGDGLPWDGRDAATMCATMLAQAMPVLLMESMYAGTEVHITNETFDSNFVATCSNLVPYSTDIPIDTHYHNFIAKLAHEVAPSVLSHPQQTINVDINSMMFGETYINISLDGGPKELFIFPTFCDTLSTPVIASRDHVRLFGADVIYLADNLTNFEKPVISQRLNTHGDGL